MANKKKSYRSNNWNVVIKKLSPDSVVTGETGKHAQ